MKQDAQKVFKADGVNLCTECFGSPTDPALLLIMGAMSSMIWWDEAFCWRLAGRGLFVIRFDNRDTGRSWEPGRPVYTVEDMADDCVRVLDFWRVRRAHLLGMSLGGMLAQIVTLKYPSRALSMSCLASSVWADAEPPLPEMDAKLLANSERTRSIDWEDREVAIDFMLTTGRLMCGGGRVFDEKRCRELSELEFERARDLRFLQNYLSLGGGEAWWNRTAEIHVPVAVLHGTDDKVLPYPHGEALARAIPGAKLVTLEGAGHELHKDDWGQVIDAVCFRVTASGQAEGKPA
ncbi:MAG: alpha/beta fold hydrolase [Synergistaceae bacterium]|nr:alpha/beta fold hydrolase [Synergistaceae bacterium]